MSESEFVVEDGVAGAVPLEGVDNGVMVLSGAVDAIVEAGTGGNWVLCP